MAEADVERTLPGLVLVKGGANGSVCNRLLLNAPSRISPPEPDDETPHRIRSEIRSAAEVDLVDP
jgi:hypothetical protein